MIQLEDNNGGAPAPAEVPPNRLKPGQDTGQGEPGLVQPPAGGSPMTQHYGGLQDQAAARFAKMKQACQTLAKVRAELDSLASLGDTVTQEDVVKAGGGLVAAGLTSAAVAALLADMPGDGEALQGWVASHDQQTQAREVQAQHALAITRHELGLTAFRHIIAHSAEGLAAGQPSESDNSNPMDLGAGNAG